MAKYNGHRSWNAWNVSLWIHHDESLYQQAMSYVQDHKTLNAAARAFARDLKGEKTPDGGVFNLTCVREAMRGMKG